MNRDEAKRCVNACAKYLRERDESPRAAKDLLEAVEVLSGEPQAVASEKKPCECSTCLDMKADLEGSGWIVRKPLPPVEPEDGRKHQGCVDHRRSLGGIIDARCPECKARNAGVMPSPERHEGVAR